MVNTWTRPGTHRRQRPLRDRADAGRRLARALAAYHKRPDVLVLGLVRGGVPVAYEIARALDVPLDILLVRKLGVPGHEELAMGAIASGGVHILNRAVIADLAIPDAAIAAVSQAEQQELERRQRRYRGDQPLTDVAGKRVILVDDGIATGATLRAAIAALRARKPAAIVVAVGVAPPENTALVAAAADEFVCLIAPSSFGSVGQWYEDFAPTDDGEVRALLVAARART